MGTFILVNVGTSLAGHLRREFGVSNLPLLEDALEFLRDLDPLSRSAGAEINSTEHLLTGMKLSASQALPPFELCFLVSQTKEGNWTGRLLAEYYRQIRGIETVQWRVAEGLCPSDHEMFTTVGLRSLVRESSSVLRDAAARGLTCVINATGGFKSQTFFVGLVGQAMGIPVVYQLEGFPKCIEVPPLPMEIESELWLTNYDLFSRLLDQEELSERDFPFHEVDPLILKLLGRRQSNGAKVYEFSPVVELMHQCVLYRLALISEEPPLALRQREAEKTYLEDDVSRHVKGAKNLVGSMVRQFPWIVDVRNHVSGLDSARSHLLPRTPDPSVHGICLSNGKRAVGLTVWTTASNEGQVCYVRAKLARFLSQWPSDRCSQTKADVLSEPLDRRLTRGVR